jgi:hypothetical protein
MNGDCRINYRVKYLIYVILAAVKTLRQWNPKEEMFPRLVRRADNLT